MMMPAATAGIISYRWNRQNEKQKRSKKLREHSSINSHDNRASKSNTNENKVIENIKAQVYMLRKKKNPAL
jgi:hypothetical protein